MSRLPDMQWDPPPKVRGRVSFVRSVKRRKPREARECGHLYRAGLAAALCDLPSREASPVLSPREAGRYALGYSVGFRRREAANGVR